MPLNQSVSYGMADLTDPRILRQLGWRRVGTKIVSDDEEAMVFGEYTAEQMTRIEKRERDQ